MTSHTDKTGKTATPDELNEAIEGLDDDAFLLLRQRAARLTWGTRYRSPNDLLSDAVSSAIEGARGTGRVGRKWPTDVPFLAFLTNAMKGIASNDRVSVATKVEVLASELVAIDGGDSDEALSTVSGASSPGVDQQLIDEAGAAELLRQRDELFSWFENDAEVSMILMGMEDGLRGAALRIECDLTEHQHEAAQTRLRRGKAKLVAQRSMQ